MSTSTGANELNQTLAEVADRRGRFIVVEGLDRAGKTTQCRLLAEALESPTNNVLQLRFPDRKTTIGCLLDAYLHKEVEIEEHAVHLLFSANRYELKNAIETALSQGRDVVCDRYTLSGISYTFARRVVSNGHSLGLKDSFMTWAQEADKFLPIPDLTIMLQISEKAAAKRQGFGKERFEQTKFQNSVKDGMNYYWHNGWPSKQRLIVDGSKEIEAVHQCILNAVKSIN